MFKALIIEDEKPAIDELKYLLSFYDFVEIVGEAQDGLEGLNFIKSLKPDIVFIDINIPKIDGIELSKIISSTKLGVVFITAYDNYAVDAFELNALDYILKPISPSRLEKSLEKAKNFLNQNELKQKKIDKIPVEEKGKIYLLDINQIVFAKSQEGFVKIVTKDSSFLFRKSMKNLEDKLQDFTQFYRVQKSYIVNLQSIYEVIPWFKSTYWLVMNDVNKTRISVSKSQVKELKKILGF
ncbi:MAG: LytR/AlgR family response regulator transcription factor [Desulfurella sp.]